ncbi:MAG: cell division protein FtsZ [Rhodobacteraceae bacterium]|nr:cell division protein FtsZ [Paracoccaceae bacterium]
MNLQSAHIVKNANLVPRIKVIGVGGAGCNSVNNMLAKGLSGAELIVANTDSQSLAASPVATKIQLGAKTTEGLGAGTDPRLGKLAAEETQDEIAEIVAGTHLCFVTAGMGGGTGTGAGPVIAKLASDTGAMTIGVVTKPFFFEGTKRMEIAEHGLCELQDALHSLIVIPNQNLFQIANERTTTKEAFSRADDVLYHGVKSVIDLILRPGLINLDFADLKTVLQMSGRALIGCGEAEGDDRGVLAAEMAMNNPLLEETTLSDAKGVLVNIIGGDDMTLFDLNDASDTVRKNVGKGANIVFGSAEDLECTGKITVSVIATGLNSRELSFVKTSPNETYDENEYWESSSAEETEAQNEFDDYSGQSETETAAYSYSEETEEQEAEHDSHFHRGHEDAEEIEHAVNGGYSEADSHADPVENVESNSQGLYVVPRRSSDELENAKEEAPNASWSKHLSKVKRRLARPTEGRFPDADLEQPRLQNPMESGFREAERQDYASRVPAFLRRQAN